MDYQSDVRVSDPILKQVSEVYRKIRNTFRFLLGNLDGFNPKTDKVAVQELPEVDRYMLVKLNKLIKQSKLSYENYEFATIYNMVNNFCTQDLSSFYLDYAKDILYCEAPNGKERMAIQNGTLRIIGQLNQIGITDPLIQLMKYGRSFRV
ncbi:class I tRNA ligase family protein [Peribacillus frigoritolerans]|nr:class I tRNA ligase family protein [Peribacillus frigoritolerans]